MRVMCSPETSSFVAAACYGIWRILLLLPQANATEQEFGQVEVNASFGRRVARPNAMAGSVARKPAKCRVAKQPASCIVDRKVILVRFHSCGEQSSFRPLAR